MSYDDRALDNAHEAAYLESHPELVDELPTCSTCGETVGGSHYHCARCMDARPTSMYGHGVTFDSGAFGFTCDRAKLGETYFGGRLTVKDEQIREPAQ